MTSATPRHSPGFNLLTLLLWVGLGALPPSVAQAATPRETQRATVAAAPISPPPVELTGGFLVGVPGGYAVAGARGSEGDNSVWTIATPGGEWRPSPVQVPRDAAVTAFGAEVITVGGTRNGIPVATAGRIRFDGGEGSMEPLPDLPSATAGAGAAVIESRLYVFGGMTGLSPAQFTTDLWILDLSNPQEWVRGPQFPGSPRALFAATAQYGMLAVIGGMGADGAALAETWVFRPLPLEGTAESGWQRLADLPEPRIAAAALPLGQAQILVIGGASGGGIDPAPAAPAAGPPLLFHTLTDAWCEFDVAIDVSRPLAASGPDGIVVLGTEPDGRPAALQMTIERNVRSLQWLDYFVIAAYFVLLSWIGLRFSGRQESSEEFALGNRQIRWWAAGLSMFATGASAISFMAIPALAFATSLVWLFPLIVFIPGYFVTAYLIFPLLRRMEITSTYEYLELRFNRLLRVIASLQCIIFLTIAKTSVVLVLPALAISSATGLNVYASVLVMGIITTIYTALGGFEAVIWTEVFQAGLMLFAPLAIIAICIANLPGGVGEFLAIGQAYHKFDFAIISWDVAVPAVWILMLMQFLTVTVAAAGDQPVIQRVFSSPLREVRRVNAVSTTCGIVIGTMVNVMGIAIFAYFHAHPGQYEPTAQNDQVVPMFVAQAMPVGAAGLVIAAIFAASMSTVASVMNSVATIFTEDFYIRFRPAASDRERVITLKTASYTVGFIGTGMALVLAAQDLNSMMVVWSQLASLLGGGIVGVYTLGMFSRRANGFGAICGAIASLGVTAAVKFTTPVHWGAYLPIAILTCIVVGYVCSLFAPARRDLDGLTVFTPSPKAR